ncbi:MAG: hypothetical protein RSF67_07755 [Clostridia bacterium]
MGKFNLTDTNQLITKAIVDTYFCNKEMLEILKNKANEVIKHYEEINKENNLQIKKLVDENKQIEKIIETFMLLNHKSEMNIEDISIYLNKNYKVSAKYKKKDLLIEYIKDKKLPVNVFIKTDYDREDLIKYLTSQEYTGSFEYITGEIEELINFKETTSIEIKKDYYK